MKYTFDFPGGYIYGFPKELNAHDWNTLQEDREQFAIYAPTMGVPIKKIDEAWMNGRWFTDDTTD